MGGGWVAGVIWDLLFHTQKWRAGRLSVGRRTVRQDISGVWSGLSFLPCRIPWHPRQEVGTGRRSSVTQPIGQSCPLAGATGYYNSSFPIIP